MLFLYVTNSLITFVKLGYGSIRILREISQRGSTLIIISKFGQNIFSHEAVTFSNWPESLTENALYKALLKAHTANDL